HRVLDVAELPRARAPRCLGGGARALLPAGDASGLDGGSHVGSPSPLNRGASGSGPSSFRAARELVVGAVSSNPRDAGADFHVGSSSPVLAARSACPGLGTRSKLAVWSSHRAHTANPFGPSFTLSTKIAFAPCGTTIVSPLITALAGVYP